MSGSLRYRVSGQLLEVEVFGELSLAAFRDGVDEALSNPALSGRVRILVDVRLTTGSRSREELEAMVEHAYRWRDRIERIAILIKSDLQFGISRMAGSAADVFGLPVAPFRDAREARAFLGVDDEVSR